MIVKFLKYLSEECSIDGLTEKSVMERLEYVAKGTKTLGGWNDGLTEKSVNMAHKESKS